MAKKEKYFKYSERLDAIMAALRNKKSYRRI